MPITRGYQQLVAEAMVQVRTWSVSQTVARLADPRTQIVDIRDIRELAEGTVVGAYHAPRGMLEFWVDPESPYHKPVFHQPGKRYVLFCAGGWRSALSAQTLQDMGLPEVGHIEGGFGAWKTAGAPVAQRPEKGALAKGPTAQGSSAD